MRYNDHTKSEISDTRKFGLNSWNKNFLLRRKNLWRNLEMIFFVLKKILKDVVVVEISQQHSYREPILWINLIKLFAEVIKMRAKINPSAKIFLNRLSFQYFIHIREKNTNININTIRQKITVLNTNKHYISLWNHEYEQRFAFSEDYALAQNLRK